MDTNSIALLRMHNQTSKNTLDSLKFVINVFRRKPSLGPDTPCNQESSGKLKP